MQGAARHSGQITRIGIPATLRFCILPTTYVCVWDECNFGAGLTSPGEMGCACVTVGRTLSGLVDMRFLNAVLYCAVYSWWNPHTVLWSWCVAGVSIFCVLHRDIALFGRNVSKVADATTDPTSSPHSHPNTQGQVLGDWDPPALPVHAFSLNLDVVPHSTIRWFSATSVLILLPASHSHV
jgi:hypothetical protein